ncbi:hypothetical protein [Nostoc sp.]
MQRQREFLQNAPRIVQAALNNDSGGVGSGDWGLGIGDWDWGR